MAKNIVQLPGRLTNMSEKAIIDTTQVDSNGTPLDEVLSSLESQVEMVAGVQRLENADLESSDLQKSGVYIIKQATHAPVGTFGRLDVSESDNGIIQQWNTGSAIANRVLKETTVVGEYSISVKEDVEDAYTDNDNLLTLKPGLTYTLSGEYFGSIKVLAPEANEEISKTTLILNNFTLISNNSQAILYEAATKKLVIDLVGKNYIEAETENQPTEVVSQVGCINSLNNLEITGVGYLSIKTNYRTHGIRAKGELSITGRPHLYISCKCNTSDLAGHDAIHSGKSLFITNGVFELCNCNDCIGIGSSADGEAIIFDGAFSCHDYAGDIVDAHDMENNTSGSKKAILYTEVILANDCSNIEIRNHSFWEQYEYTAIISKKGKITDENNISLTSDNGNYEIPAGHDNKSFTVSGVISGNITVKSQAVDLILDNAIIFGNVEYQPTAKKLKIDCVDNDVFGQSDSIKGDSENKINIIYGDLISNNNLAIEGKAVLIVKGDTKAKGKALLWGDGNKYFDNLLCGKFYFGADDDKVDAFIGGTGEEPKNSDQLLYIQSLYSGDSAIAQGFTVSTKPEKYSSSVYKYQKSYILIKIYHPSSAGIKTATDTIYAADDEFLSTKYITNYTDLTNWKDYSSEKQIRGEWKILDPDSYVKVGEVDSLKIYNNIDSANSDINDIKVGELVSIKKDSSENYLADYDIYLCVQTGNGKTLKLVEQGSGSSSYTGSLDFAVTSVKIGENEPISIEDLGNTRIEANIGDPIVISMTFESSENADVLGKIYGRVNGETAFTKSVYPRNGVTTVWSYPTSNLSTGTYTFTLYGVESTKRSSSRVSFSVLVGGLNLSTKLEDDTMIRNESDYSIPVTVSAANTTDEILLTVKLDNEDIFNNIVSNGNRSIILSRNILTSGSHSLLMYLTQNGKKSNEISRNIIVAEEDVLYVIPENNVYASYYGTRAEIALKVLEYGYSSAKFQASMVVRNKTGEVQTINGQTENNYTFNYGKNIVSLIGLKKEADDGIIEIEGKEIKYTEYTVRFDVSSPNDNTEDQSAELKVRILENDYNIQPESEDLLCWFDASENSNNSANRDKWNDKSGNNVNVKFNNFNWTSNGWLNVDESGEVSANGSLALKIDSGAYAEIDLAPFENEVNEMTISVDFSTRDILDSKAKVVSCLFESEGEEIVKYYLRNGFGEYVKTFTESSEKTTTNITNYFKNVGGYCWLDGITYTGDGVTPYETTMVVKEYTLNLNAGDKDPNYQEEIAEGETRSYLIKNTGTSTKTVTKQTGFYIDTQQAVLTTAADSENVEKKFHLYFSENTRTRIDLIIHRNTDGPYYFSSLIGYTNGCLSLMQDLPIDATNAHFTSINNGQNVKAKIYLGAKVSVTGEAGYEQDVVSDTGSCEIYSFRIYNKALTPEQALYNYASEIPVMSDKIAFIDNNGIGIDKNALGQLPNITLIGADVNGANTIDQFIMQLANTQESQISQLKSIKQPAYITYEDPSDPSKTWNNGQKLPIRLQFQRHIKHGLSLQKL